MIEILARASTSQTVSGANHGMTLLQEASRKLPITLLVGAASSIFQPIHPLFPPIDEISVVTFFALWKDATLE